MKKSNYQKLWFLVLLFLFPHVSIDAQKFICTDVSVLDPKESESSVQELKNDYLGLTFGLEFYDKSLKVTATWQGKVQSHVFDKVNETTYQAVISRYRRNGVSYVEKWEINLNKITGYIKSISLTKKRNSDILMKCACKRKSIF